jgi:phosphatidylglycerol---prolipoprotein diacylglyceryl transferase
MYPTLINLGSVAISTSSFFTLLAFLTTAFVYWRKTREEHYHQDQAFDAFLLASVVGLLAGRFGFILFNFGELGKNLWNWFDVINHPGSLDLFSLLGASLYLYRYAGKQKWDQFEVLDFWFLAISAGMVLKQLGSFFAGTGFGYETQLPWGIIFPGVFAKYHPTQIYAALFFLGLYTYLSWAEYHYRNFSWYRAGKKTAQTGFLTCIFLIAMGLFMLLMQLVKPAQLEIGQLRLDYVVYGVMTLFGGVMMYIKSGRLITLRGKKN